MTTLGILTTLKEHFYHILENVYMSIVEEKRLMAREGFY